MSIWARLLESLASYFLLFSHSKFSILGISAQIFCKKSGGMLAFRKLTLHLPAVKMPRMRDLVVVYDLGSNMLPAE